MAENLVLNVKETAELLKLCPNSVRAAIKAGEIPSVRIGRRILISRQRVESILAGKTK